MDNKWYFVFNLTSYNFKYNFGLFEKIHFRKDLIHWYFSQTVEDDGGKAKKFLKGYQQPTSIIITTKNLKYSKFESFFCLAIFPNHSSWRFWRQSLTTHIVRTSKYFSAKQLPLSYKKMMNWKTFQYRSDNKISKKSRFTTTLDR